MTAPQLGEGESNPGAPADESAARWLTGGSMPGFACGRRAWRGAAAPFRLLPQVSAGDDPGQDAQPLPHGLSLDRRAIPHPGPGRVGSLHLPAVVPLVVSHHVPPPVLTVWRAGKTGVIPRKGLHPCNPNPFQGITCRATVLMSSCCTAKRFGRKLQTRAVAKLNSREFAPYRPKAANTLCKGPVAGNFKLFRKLQREKPGGETVERGANGGTAVEEERFPAMKMKRRRRAKLNRRTGPPARRTAIAPGHFHSGWAVRKSEGHFKAQPGPFPKLKRVVFGTWEGVFGTGVFPGSVSIR